MDFANWFNPYDRNHLKAFEHLQKHGSWPKNFIHPGIDRATAGYYTLVCQEKMSQAWLDAVNFHTDGKIRELLK